MENIVNLEQLDYRDQLIKEYIDGHSGGGSSLFCELEVDVNLDDTPRAHLYLKCHKGEILETDTLQFARNTSTPTKWEIVSEKDGVKRTCVKRRRGWIIPKPYNYVNLYKVYDEEKSNSSEKYDYWEVLPKNRDLDEVTWEQLIEEFLYQRHINISEGEWYQDVRTITAFGRFNYNYACFINRWCGVAIKRDEKNITKYMRWMICGPDNRYESRSRYTHFQSSYCKNGSFILGCGPDESESGDLETKYAYGLRI